MYNNTRKYEKKMRRINYHEMAVENFVTVCSYLKHKILMKIFLNIIAL